mmetsp:Transcript_33572/g.70612  ORF Transcript_33572/g.70612 Transcript_33572/m.70612 type:complete len:426 (+) Transcript_33572:1672-2949(+)
MDSHVGRVGDVVGGADDRRGEGFFRRGRYDVVLVVRSGGFVPIVGKGRRRGRSNGRDGRIHGNDSFPPAHGQQTILRRRRRRVRYAGEGGVVGGRIAGIETCQFDGSGDVVKRRRRCRRCGNFNAHVVRMLLRRTRTSAIARQIALGRRLRRQRGMQRFRNLVLVHHRQCVFRQIPLFQFARHGRVGRIDDGGGGEQDILGERSSQRGDFLAVAKGLEVRRRGGAASRVGASSSSSSSLLVVVISIGTAAALLVQILQVAALAAAPTQITGNFKNVPPIGIRAAIVALLDMIDMDDCIVVIIISIVRQQGLIVLGQCLGRQFDRHIHRCGCHDRGGNGEHCGCGPIGIVIGSAIGPYRGSGGVVVDINIICTTLHSCSIVVVVVVVVIMDAAVVRIARARSLSVTTTTPTSSSVVGEDLSPWWIG